MSFWQPTRYLPMSSKRIRKKKLKQSGQYLSCLLCGRGLNIANQNFVYGKSGAVCNTCLRAGHILAVKKAIPKIITQPVILTPQQLMEKLDTIIVGQEQAKRAISLAMWKQQLRADGMEHVPCSHMLLYGPSGCGKTYLASQAAKLCGLPYLVFDATTLTEAGYKGRDAGDILKDYRSENDGNPKIDHGIIILDEIDKLAGVGSAERQAHFRGTQHTLLKMLEQNDGLLYIFCGAFQGLYDRKETPVVGFEQSKSRRHRQITVEALIGYGMERELMGRISAQVPIQALTEADLISLLLEKDDSAFQLYRRFFREYGIDLYIKEEEARKFAAAALQNGTGARGLRSELDRCMEPLLLKLAEGTTENHMEVQYVGVGTGDV